MKSQKILLKPHGNLIEISSKSLNFRGYGYGILMVNPIVISWKSHGNLMKNLMEISWKPYGNRIETLRKSHGNLTEISL